MRTAAPEKSRVAPGVWLAGTYCSRVGPVLVVDFGRRRHAARHPDGLRNAVGDVLEARDEAGRDLVVPPDEENAVAVTNVAGYDHARLQIADRHVTDDPVGAELFELNESSQR